MSNIYVLCEGQTEEMFVNQVLCPYVQGVSGVFLTPIILTTKKTPKKKHKGGLVSYEKAKNEIQKLCSEHPNEYVTTMLDFYAFPVDAPGMGQIDGIKDVYERVKHIESEISKDIGRKNFIPNLMLHEFEGLLFVKPELLSEYYQESADAAKSLVNVRDEFETPEHIDNGKETAPSKRITSIIPEYDKVFAGSLIAIDIGIDDIRKECRHFSAWVDKLCSLK
ncbi:MAG: DUF4276 family protein [Clostridiales bacterium]|nr:DUF4276 family protein [Clostridiales bacterium]